MFEWCGNGSSLRGDCGATSATNCACGRVCLTRWRGHTHRLTHMCAGDSLATPTFDSTLQAALLERSYRAMWDFRRAAGLSHARVAPRQSLWHIVVDPQDRHTPVPTAELVREIAAQREVADGGVPSQQVWSQLAVRCGGARALQAVLRLESRIDTAIQTGLREQRVSFCVWCGACKAIAGADRGGWLDTGGSSCRGCGCV